MVSAAFVSMVFSMHVAGTTQWVSAAQLPTLDSPADSEAQADPLQLVYDDRDDIKGLASCTPERHGCDISALLREITD